LIALFVFGIFVHIARMHHRTHAYANVGDEEEGGGVIARFIGLGCGGRK
jgi:hypothetical protein